MGKKYLTILTMLILLIAVMAFTGCSTLGGEDVTITFEPNGGSEVASVTAKPGAIIDVPDAPTREGYGFDGWYLDENFENMYIFGVMGTENIKLYAKWVTSYAIVLHGNGGTGTNVDSYPVGGSVALPTDWTRDKYIFDGWYRNEECTGDRVTEIGEGSRGTRHFFAKWRLPQDFTITLVDNVAEGDQVVDPILGGFIDRYTEGKGTTLPEVTRPGYVFEGWFDNVDFTGDQYYDVSALSTGDLTFYAKWRALEYTITFNIVDDHALDVPDPVKLTTDTVLDLPIPESNSNIHLFDAWYIDELCSTRFEGTKMPPSDITLYGRFVEGCPINFCYLIKGGESKWAQLLYNIGEEIVGVEELLDVSSGTEYAQPGMTFDGWYYDSDFTTPVTYPFIADKQLSMYAKWTSALTKGFFPHKAEFDKAKAGYIDINDRETLSRFMEYMIFEADRTQHYYVNVTYINNTGDADMDNDLVHSTLSEAYDGSTMANTDYDASYEVDNIKHMQLYLMDTFIADNYETAKGQMADLKGKELPSIFDGKYESNRAANFDEFKYSFRKDEVSVRYSDQLFYALEHDMKPVPVVGSSAERMLNRAKEILRSICDDRMDNVNKTFAIYKWLVKECVYDYAAADKAKNPDYIYAKNADKCNAFHMEGIFDNGIAVCDGISKAYSVLCNVEGIPCIRIEGNGHAWNKVYLDIDGDGNSEWYCTDATWGNGHDEGPTTEYMNTYNFLFTDAEKKVMGYEARNYLSKEFEAKTDVDFGEIYTVQNGANKIDLSVGSDIELAELISYVHSAYNNYGEPIDCISIDVYFSRAYLKAIDAIPSIQSLYEKVMKKISTAVDTANSTNAGIDFRQTVYYPPDETLETVNAITIILYGNKGKALASQSLVA